MRLKIRTKLLLAIGLPYLALAAAALSIDYARQRAVAFEAAQRQLAQVAGRGAAELEGFFRAAASVARTAADVTAARGVPRDGEIFASLSEMLRSNPGLYGSCFALAPGEPPGRARFGPYVCRDGAGLREMDLSTAYDYTKPEWEWFAKPFADGEPWWTEPYFDEGAGNAAMVTYSVPVRVGGRLAAIQTVDILLEDLQRRLALPVEFEGARWMILSRKGTFVSVKDKDLLLTATVFDLAERLGRPGLAAIGESMVAGESGSAWFPGFEGGERRLASFEPIRSTGWSFAMHVPESAVLGPVYAALRWRLAGAAAVSLVLLGVVLGAAIWISRPIPRLAAAVRELSSGKLDARVVGVDSRDEFGELARGFNSMVEELNRHVERLTTETASRERVESELRLARDIQLSLLPGTFPPFPHRKEFDLHAMNSAARSIAGDFFDFEFVGNDRLFFVIADVSGKGIPAAMLMAVTRTLLRNLNRALESPGEILESVNRVLVPENLRMMFVTLVLGSYDAKTGKVVYANAGHPLPRVLRADGSVRSFGKVTGTLLGVFEGEKWADGEEEIAPGESLVLFTDGVSEAGAGSRAMYGVNRLDDVLRQNAGVGARELAEAVVTDVERYQRGVQADDVTVMALRRNM